MSIRSIALEIASNEKKKADSELNELKKEISFWQKAYENDKSGTYKSLAESKLNILLAKRDKFLNQRGEYLSQRVKTKWYNEGEKSNKYFLNLQRSKAKNAEMTEIIEDGQAITDSELIKAKVESFYKTLYEKGDKHIGNEQKIGLFLAGLDEIDESGIRNLDKNLTEHDLLETLKTCSDSAPGPDGIPYSLIKLTWNYYGKLLINSWEYAQKTGSLTHSHQYSYLRLIPKEGKPTNQLKNWRPITLSNCDFKIITKTLAKKLTETVSKIIGYSQTAYIPGRQITDNLHLMLYSVESPKLNHTSMITSLDAEKAFDSVEHWYIKAIFKKLNLKNFEKLFDLMYRNQQVDILLNGGTAGSYNIRNGVKQGDALSCILFILSMEPLIRNISNDTSISAISDKIPKVLAYADVITCITKPNETNLEKIFRHYDKLTEVSGLKLNADKTEIISKGGPQTYNVNYQGKIFTLEPTSKIKVNGIVLSYDEKELKKLNLEKVYESMSKQLRQWSNRGLSLLGKIQIYKTFGLSQILYLGSIMMLNKRDEIKFNELIYRFIWNRDMETTKAPDRIKRQILKTKISNLGFGMIDFMEVIKSIRIKTLFRVLNEDKHPLNGLLRQNISRSLIRLNYLERTRECLDQAIIDVARIWKQTIKNCNDELVNSLREIIGKEYIGNIIETRFKNKRLGLRHKHDTVNEIMAISKTHPILKK